MKTYCSVLDKGRIHISSPKILQFYQILNSSILTLERIYLFKHLFALRNNVNECYDSFSTRSRTNAFIFAVFSSSMKGSGAAGRSGGS